MGTRGVTGFRIEDQDKIGYQQFDSYPDGVGFTVINQVNTLLKDKEEFKKAVSDLQVINGKTPPTPEQIKNLKLYQDLRVGNQSNTEWYCLLRKTQGDPKLVLDAGFWFSDR